MRTSSAEQGGAFKAQRLVFQDVEPGGSANYLFLLSAEQSTGHPDRPRKLTGALGKLELRWRSSSAALGRLQTQQIMANAAAQDRPQHLTAVSAPGKLSAVEAMPTIRQHPSYSLQGRPQHKESVLAVTQASCCFSC